MTRTAHKCDKRCLSPIKAKEIPSPVAYRCNETAKIYDIEWALGDERPILILKERNPEFWDAFTSEEIAENLTKLAELIERGVARYLSEIRISE